MRIFSGFFAVILVFSVNISDTRSHIVTVSQILEWIFPITIVEKKTLNFGEIESPNQKVHVTVTPNGQHSGTAAMLNSANVSEGRYKIHGAGFLSIAISSHDLNSYPFMTYRNIRGKYPGASNFNMLIGRSNLHPPGNSGKTLRVGATLEVAAGTQNGHYQPAFAIEVIYD